MTVCDLIQKAMWISKTLKMCKKMNPKLKWVISFADGMMWKNGTIYQSANLHTPGLGKTEECGIQKMGIGYIAYHYGISTRQFKEMF